MEEEGVKFVTNVNVGKDIKAEELLKQFDRVILACGASNPRDIKVPGRDAKGIYFAVDFLGQVTKALLDSDFAKVPYELAKGKNVLVIGGGDTGNDCVGTSIRLGAKSVIQLEMMPKPPVERTPSNPWPQWPRVLKTDYGQEEAIAVFGHDPRVYQTTVTGRRSIFPNLGFDTFTSEEYMARENEKNPNGWVKDEVLTDEILKCLDSTEGPDYVYTISVQGHGAYPDEQILEDPEITVSGAPTEEENNKWEYYVNEIHEMDNFVKELTDKLADYPEDVVLVMYGDHLPTMGLTVEDLKNKYLFQTEYVMWDNFGLKKKNENLAAYQMAAEVMDRVGIHEGTVFRYHQARRNTRNYQVDLETLQYDLLYGKRYSYGESGDSPYLRTRMRMGIYDVTLDSIQCISEADHTYYIKGTEFTPSSEIKLNGEWYDTVYINPTTLMITGTELNDFDRLAVIQRSNSSTRKPLSKSYDRSCYALYSNNKWKLTESAGTNEN